MKFNPNSLTGNDKINDSPIIGAIKVNKLFTYHNNNYEVAAWWQDEEAQLGVYPVRLRRSHLHPKHLFAYAAIPGKIVDDNFPALWGGIAISNEPYKCKNKGEQTIIHHRMNILEAIKNSGVIPGRDIDVFIHGSWWPIIVDEAMTELKRAYSILPEYWDRFDALDKNTFKDIGNWDFDSELRSRIGMVAHMGGEIEKWARCIEEINRLQGYRSQYWNDLHANNTEWTKEIEIQINE